MTRFLFEYTIILSFTSKREMLRVCGLFCSEKGFWLSNCKPDKEKKFCSLEVETNFDIYQLVKFLENNGVKSVEGIKDETGGGLYYPPLWSRFAM